MSKLLRAYFIRLSKWNIYWILMAFMFVCGVVGTLLFGKEIAFQIPNTISCLIFPHYIGLVIGLFNYPLFTNGTIKNQIIVGHSRNNIFIANWITSVLFTVSLYLVVTLGIFGVGFFASNKSDVDINRLIWGVILSSLCNIFFTTVSMVFCVIFKGVKSFAFIYIVNQVLVVAGVGLLKIEKFKDICNCLLPSAVCLQLSSYKHNKNPLTITGVIYNTNYVLALFMILFEIALVFTIGILYFRKTDLN